MNRNKILESFSSKFKTRKVNDMNNVSDRKMKKEILRSARRAAAEEEEMVWESHREVREK